MGPWRTIQDAPPRQTLRLRPQGDIGCGRKGRALPRTEVRGCRGERRCRARKVIQGSPARQTASRRVARRVRGPGLKMWPHDRQRRQVLSRERSFSRRTVLSEPQRGQTSSPPSGRRGPGRRRAPIIAPAPTPDLHGRNCSDLITGAERAPPCRSERSEESGGGWARGGPSRMPHPTRPFGCGLRVTLGVV